MDIRSKTPLWPAIDDDGDRRPPLDEPAQCDVAVIGGGVTGALVTMALVDRGLDTVTVDRRHVAAGSTAASTALLQYELDTTLAELVDRYGEKHARRVQHLCIEAVDDIEKLAARIGDTSFHRRDSLYLASRARDVDTLQTEFAWRRAFDLDAHWLDRNTLRATHDIDRPAAILTRNAGQIDPYRFTHALLAAAEKKGARVHDHTDIEHITRKNRGFELRTNQNITLHARRVVHATGYEIPKKVSKRILDLTSTYAYASPPMGPQELWPSEAMIWETARPYIYARITHDRRILVGGRDEPFKNPTQRDRLITTKTNALQRDLQRIFPHLDHDIEYAWAGTFGQTRDSLAYIGTPHDHPGQLFALGYGANGIIFAAIAARIIADLATGQRTADARRFRFGR